MARHVHRTLVVGLALLGLASAPAWGSDHELHKKDLRGDLRELVTLTVSVLRNVWGKNGSSLDPFGNPTQGTQTGATAPQQDEDNGSSLDPFGKP